MTDQNSTYALIIQEAPANPSDLREAARHLSSLFPVPVRRSIQILKRAPLQFVELPGTDMAKLKSSLQELSKEGLTFRLSVSPPEDLSMVVWAQEPTVTADQNGGWSVALRREAFRSMVSCPGCGEDVEIRSISPKARSIQTKPRDEQVQDQADVSEQTEPTESYEDAQPVEAETGHEEGEPEPSIPELPVRGEIKQPIRADFLQFESNSDHSPEDSATEKTDESESAAEEVVELDMSNTNTEV